MRAGPAIWGSGWRARSAPDSLGFWTPLFAKIIGNPWENQRFGAPSAPDFWRFGHPLFAKMLEILGKINVSAREARPIFWVLGTPFSRKCWKTLGNQHFGARSAPDSLGFWVPLLGRVLVKIEKSWAELIHWNPEQFFSAIRRVDWWKSFLKKNLRKVFLSASRGG